MGDAHYLSWTNSLRGRVSVLSTAYPLEISPCLGPGHHPHSDVIHPNSEALAPGKMVLLPARSVFLVKAIAMTSLRLRMMEDMQVRNLSRHTQDSYLLQVSQFARHFAKSPDFARPGGYPRLPGLFDEREEAGATLGASDRRSASISLPRHARPRLGISTGLFRAQRRQRHWPSFSALRRCCTSLAASRASNTRRS
jgi:hypothetical protein